MVEDTMNKIRGLCRNIDPIGDLMDEEIVIDFMGEVYKIKRIDVEAFLASKGIKFIYD